MLIKASARFGASPNALEELMLDASRTLDVKVTVVRKAGAITCLVGDRAGSRRFVRIVSPLIRISYFLGLLEVRGIYDAVVDKQMRVPEAHKALARLAARPAVRYPLVHMLVACVFSGMVCWTLFRGLYHDVLVSVVVTIALGIAQYAVRKVTPFRAEVLE